MTVYHTSPDKIEKITKNGLFADCLFFSETPYSMSISNVHTYKINVKTIKVSEFFYNDDCEKLNNIVNDIMTYFNTDKETAENLLDSTIESWELSDETEDNFYIQAKQGEAGKIIGYDGAESEDEQGTVYIIPMFERELDLIIK